MKSSSAPPSFSIDRSLPTRERGLKYKFRAFYNLRSPSLPTRERGLKSGNVCTYGSDGNVAPYAGAWIEIRQSEIRQETSRVAPYAGAWIEISVPTAGRCTWTVAPYAGAWIEIGIFFSCAGSSGVAPYAGAWIEIVPCVRQRSVPSRRSLCGSVD